VQVEKDEELGCQTAGESIFSFAKKIMDDPIHNFFSKIMTFHPQFF